MYIVIMIEDPLPCKVSVLLVKRMTCAHMQVGRSGRFGHLGLAVNLITYEDRFNL